MCATTFIPLLLRRRKHAQRKKLVTFFRNNQNQRQILSVIQLVTDSDYPVKITQYVSLFFIGIKRDMSI
jgi:hypothetical protein